MLTPDELEAAVLGAQWVTMRGDPVLANAARDLLGDDGLALVGSKRRRRLIDPQFHREQSSCPAISYPVDAVTHGLVKSAKQFIRDVRTEL